MWGGAAYRFMTDKATSLLQSHISGLFCLNIDLVKFIHSFPNNPNKAYIKSDIQLMLFADNIHKFIKIINFMDKDSLGG